jgi:N-acetylglucosamine-6-phosphate deacetylase
MPTVITDHPDVLDRAADAAIAAQADPGIVGLHIEGPHIAKARRGTHDGAFIRPLDDRTMQVVARLRRAGVLVMLTLAPEAASLEKITALAELGAVVSIGHTDATAEHVEAAINAGASCATHLFNAMSPMATRAPGTAGAVLNAEIYAGIICDGHHVDDRMIQLALRGRPLSDRLFLVSDAMSTVGGPDHFDLYGQPVHLENGKLINKEGGLAGAHVTQAEGVQRLVQVLGVEPEHALRMAITTPAAAVYQPSLAELIGRSLNDILHLADDMQVLGDLAGMVSGPTTVDAAE